MDEEDDYNSTDEENVPIAEDEDDEQLYDNFRKLTQRKVKGTNLLNELLSRLNIRDYKAYIDDHNNYKLDLKIPSLTRQRLQAIVDAFAIFQNDDEQLLLDLGLRNVRRDVNEIKIVSVELAIISNHRDSSNDGIYLLTEQISVERAYAILFNLLERMINKEENEKDMFAFLEDAVVASIKSKMKGRHIDDINLENITLIIKFNLSHVLNAVRLERILHRRTPFTSVAQPSLLSAVIKQKNDDVLKARDSLVERLENLRSNRLNETLYDMTDRSELYQWLKRVLLVDINNSSSERKFKDVIYQWIREFF